MIEINSRVAITEDEIDFEFIRLRARRPERQQGLDGRPAPVRCTGSRRCRKTSRRADPPRRQTFGDDGFLAIHARTGRLRRRTVATRSSAWSSWSRKPSFAPRCAAQRNPPWGLESAGSKANADAGETKQGRRTREPGED